MVSRWVMGLAAAAAVAGPARADFIVLNRGHADVEVAYVGGALVVEAHLEDYPNPGEELHVPLNEILFHSRPGFSQSGDLNGVTYYVYPQVENPELPFLGIAAGHDDEDPFEVFDAVELQFLGVTGWGGSPAPGAFALWQNAPLFGQPSVVVSSAAGVFGSVALTNGAHEHFNWGFTAPGLYAVQVRAVGSVGGDQTFSDTYSVLFGVEALPEPVPEPASAVVFALGGLGLVAARRRRLV